MILVPPLAPTTAKTFFFSFRTIVGLILDTGLYNVSLKIIMIITMNDNIITILKKQSWIEKLVLN